MIITKYFAEIKKLLSRMGKKSSSEKCVFEVKDARWFELLTFEKAFSDGGIFTKFMV